MLHFADRVTPVAQLRMLLFDGATAPSLEWITQTLHQLRRHGAYLQVLRDADPGAEIFSLAPEDEVGVQALSQMREAAQEFLPHDRRVLEIVLQACDEERWPLAAVLHGETLMTPWRERLRAVHTTVLTDLNADEIRCRYDGVRAGQADGYLLMLLPGTACSSDAWTEMRDMLDGPCADTVICWWPREVTPTEYDLWREFAAWQQAAVHCDGTGIRHNLQVAQRCRERAAELRSAVQASLRTVYLQGCWRHAGETTAFPVMGTTLTDVLAGTFTAGFDRVYPVGAVISMEGTPTPHACQQLLEHFVQHGALSFTPQSLLWDYLERFLVPLGCVKEDGAHARLIPPRREILEPLLDFVANGVKRVSELTTFLQRAPFGFTTEQARLVTAASVRSGVLRALDAFMQPTDIMPFSQSDAVVFLDVPAPLEETYRPVVTALAEQWAISAEVWPATCYQVERQLREWLTACQQRIPVTRDSLARWNDALHALPWSWRDTEAMLETLATCESNTSFTALLDSLGPDSGNLPHRFNRIWEAANWWQRVEPSLRMLLQAKLPLELCGERDTIAALLIEGEAQLAQLSEIDSRFTVCMANYSAAYHQWHDATFGNAIIEALRSTFASDEFQAIKQLARLPLPCPAPALRCLEGLAQARSGYCSGAWQQFAIAGCCAHCGLPLGSASPLPDAAALRLLASEGLSAYAALLRTHPWAEEVRQRVTRGPDGLVPRVTALLNWEPNLGAGTIRTLLDDEVLHWLCREQSTNGSRHVDELQHRLHGRDLTLRESLSAVQTWLDPEGTLNDDALLRFE